jgi:hypothetical protein
MNMNIKPLSRLLGFAAVGGAIGAFAIGGPVAIIGGLLLGGLAEEVYARVTPKNIHD